MELNVPICSSSHFSVNNRCISIFNWCQLFACLFINLEAAYVFRLWAEIHNWSGEIWAIWQRASLFPAHTYIRTKTFINPKINDGLRYALATLSHQMCVGKSNKRLWEKEQDIRQTKRLLISFWSFLLKVHCHLLSVKYLMYSVLCNAFTTHYIQLISSVLE